MYATLVSCQHPRIHQSIIRASVATATFTWVLRVDKITPCLLYIRSARLLVYQPRTSRHPGDTHPSDTEWARPLTIFQSGHIAHLRFSQHGHIASRLWGELPRFPKFSKTTHRSTEFSDFTQNSFANSDNTANSSSVRRGRFSRKMKNEK